MQGSKVTPFHFLPYPTRSDFFSFSDDEIIKEGIHRLSEVIKEEMTYSYKQGPGFREGV